MAIFREEQRFGQKWVWAIVLGASATVIGIFGYAMLEQFVYGRPWGDNPMSDTWLAVTGGIAISLLGIGLPILFYKLRLITEVNE